MLDHTPCEPDFLLWPEILELSSDFVFGFFSHATGIEDDDIRLFDIIYLDSSAVMQDGFDSRAIAIVHLASVDDDVEGFHINGL
jgi:hypothetical protein